MHRGRSGRIAMQSIAAQFFEEIPFGDSRPPNRD
jgi:hypothetical protein